MNQRVEKRTFSSSEVGDSFDLQVNLPEGAKDVPVLIYLDAHLPTGKWMPKLVGKMQENGQIPPLMTVGIGQRGSLFRKRNRDFIPPPRQSEQGFYSRRKGYGQANRFYGFLEQELLPWVRDHYPIAEEWVLAGHSLGGLFAIYSMLRPDTPFKKVISLSPSVWINRRNILRIGEHFREGGGKLGGNLYLAAGALEEFNLILPGMRAFARWAETSENPDLVLRTEKLAWKNHFTVARPGMERGLQWLFS